VADKKFSQFTPKVTPVSTDEVVGISGVDNIKVPFSALATAAQGAKADTAVQGITPTAPITSTGTTTKTIGITPATTSAAGSMSAADKTKLDTLVAGGVSDGDKGDITVSSNGAVWEIDPLAVGTSELANSAVTGPKLASASVDNTKMTFVAEATIKGRNIGQGTGQVQDLTGAQVGAMITLADLGDTSILLPANSQVLSYDDTTAEWKNKDLPESTPSPSQITYKYNTNPSDADPGNAYFRLNAETRANATFIYFDDVTANYVNARDKLLLATTGDTVYMQDPPDSGRAVGYTLTGPAVAASGYVKFPVAVSLAPTGAEFANNMTIVMLVNIAAISGGGGTGGSGTPFTMGPTTPTNTDDTLGSVFLNTTTGKFYVFTA
jgi:hypothetical protein